MFEYTAQETFYNAAMMETPCEQGTLVLFPSWLEHYTDDNTTDNRVTISFNTNYLK
jgi:ectoine hydroxylase-related dioxygenase (phytanoyl-CoA dioxygenase family)